MAVNDEGATYFLIEVRREAGEDTWTAESVSSHHDDHEGSRVQLFVDGTMPRGHAGRSFGATGIDRSDGRSDRADRRDGLSLRDISLTRHDTDPRGFAGVYVLERSLAGRRLRKALVADSRASEMTW